MRTTFHGQLIHIPADMPRRLTGTLGVPSPAPSGVRRIVAIVEVEHTDTTDLRIVAIAPDGAETTVHDRERLPGISHRLAVEVPVGRVDGQWTLRVDDVRGRDGGRVTAWRIQLEQAVSDFSIEVEFSGGLATHHRAAFEAAAARWSEVIVGDLPEATLSNGRRVDDVLIFARGADIDGGGGILGQAGPTTLRWDSDLPITGVMEFDVADLDGMDADGILDDVIIHEMGHVLGFPTVARMRGLMAGLGTPEPVFTGRLAGAEYASLGGTGLPPLETQGGPGTREAHWSESRFDAELMTGFVERGANPLSRLTAAAFADMGYDVDPDAADAYSLGLRAARASARGPRRSCGCAGMSDPVRVGGPA